MCGIIFSYNENQDPHRHRETIERALQQMRHRGPDENGIQQNGSCIIAHTRLSIVDLSASQQPFVDPSGRYTISFNGEIYNYQSLRRTLEGRWQFKTQGDTEVLLAGLVIFGKDFIEKLHGMWAFALWDNLEHSLLLCRDRLGKKPLYYHQGQGHFACASELPTLVTALDHKVNEDFSSTADYFRYGYYLPGHTIFEEIKEVLPGHTLEWSTDNKLKQESYWSIAPAKNIGDIETACQQTRDTLIDAVSKRMIADVEVGAFLSGGVDSSLIVAIMSQHLGQKPKTFTMGFSEDSFDERPFATIIAERYQTEHYEDVLCNWAPEQLNQLIMSHIGQPFADASILPTALVSGLAAKHVKVALSGDGGDELFSGYQRYQARTILRWYTRLPTPLRNNLEKVIKAIPEPITHHSRSLIKKAHLFISTIERLDSETPYIAPMFYSNQDLKQLIPGDYQRGHEAPGDAMATNLDDIQQMMYRDSLIYLPQDVLLKVDRASMAYSLEARAPFLDHKVVETAFSIPVHLHRNQIAGKKVLKQTFKNLLPNSIWQRRKQGFGVPLSQWFKTFLGDELANLNETTSTILNRQFISNLLRQHQQGLRDNNLRLWQIYCYLKWHQLRNNK